MSRGSDEKKPFVDTLFDRLDKSVTELKHVSHNGTIALLWETWRKPVIAVLCLVFLAAIGAAGWYAGGHSVVVQESPRYLNEAENLKWANSDFEESKQDIANRQSQMKQASTQLDQIKTERAQMSQLLKEIRQVAQPQDSPSITVNAIGDVSSSITYSTIPFTVHNNTQNVLTNYQVYYEALDSNGNILDAGYALPESGATCEPNSDCAISSLNMFNPAGSTIVPIYWTANTANNDWHDGYYGTDVIRKQF
ncbi:hypothetical protein [Bifidobacterium olomucense]|uniref:Uncharacterized protein n=1 Tax=Bifidobacterium olomucense TaxID=2675324 RepID=A0A7Y0HW36_9BIFI|nr:hypothetical protein [Bifidobacterium sp. DSM 109959]NMM97906.1 hypothetical protein [Bifidobacterium sp. DSM 109959]